MKRIFIFILTAAMLATCILPAYADIAGFDFDLEDVICKPLTEEEKAVLLDTSFYDESMEDRSLVDMPMLRWYKLSDSYFRYPLERVLTEAVAFESRGNSDEYIVFDDVPYKLGVLMHEDDTAEIGVLEDYRKMSIPNAVRDIISLQKSNNYDGDYYVISDVYLFETYNKDFEAVVYIVTDNGTFARVYRNDNSPSEFYTQAGFAAACSEYFDARTKWLNAQGGIVDGEFPRSFDEFADQYTMEDFFVRKKIYTSPYEDDIKVISIMVLVVILLADVTFVAWRMAKRKGVKKK